MSAVLSAAKWSYVAIQVLALISTFVAFGAQLISEDDGEGNGASWKWNEVEFTLRFLPTSAPVYVTSKYDSSADDPRLRGCLGGGQGLVGLAVVSLFVFVLLSLPLAILRALGREHMFPRLGNDSNTYTKVELWCALWHAFSFFCQCVIWGGTCMRLVKEDEPNANADVKATGFAYIGFCCALVLLNLGVMWYLRGQKLAEGGSTAVPSTSSADPTRFSSVYNQAATSDGQSAAPAPAPAAAGYGAEPQGAPAVSAGAGGATAGGGYQTF